MLVWSNRRGYRRPPLPQGRVRAGAAVQGGVAHAARDGVTAFARQDDFFIRAAVDVATVRAAEEYVVVALTVESVGATSTEQGVVVGICVWADLGPASEAVAPRGRGGSGSPMSGSNQSLNGRELSSMISSNSSMLFHGNSLPYNSLSPIRASRKPSLS